MEELFVQLNLCQSQDAKALLSHPFGAWLLLLPGFVAALAKGITIACERRRARKQNQPSAAARINQHFLKKTPVNPTGSSAQADSSRQVQAKKPAINTPATLP